MSEFNWTPARKALLSYMEHQSEERWCAGWLTSLHKALSDDKTYQWLVAQAGGTFAWAGDYEGEYVSDTWRDLVWIEQQSI